MPIPMRHANADAKSREDDDRFVLDGLRRRRSRRPRARATDESAKGPLMTIRQRLLSQLKCLLTDRSRRIPPPLQVVRAVRLGRPQDDRTGWFVGRCRVVPLGPRQRWTQKGAQSIGRSSHLRASISTVTDRRRSARRSSPLSTNAISSSSLALARRSPSRSRPLRRTRTGRARGSHG